MRLNKPQRDALPDSDFAGPGRSFPIPDKGHAHAALGLINNAPPAARPRIRARAEEMLHSGRAAGGMVENSDGVPEIDNDPEDDISPVERAMHEHIYAKGHAAAAMPHDKRMPEHWADIQRYHETFGTDAKREPEVHRAKAHLDKLLAEREEEAGEQEEPAESPAAERREEMQEGRKTGGMVGYSTGGKIADGARKAAAILMLIHPGMPKAAGARR